MSRFVLTAAAALLFASSASAAGPCMNKFIYRSDGPRQVITLLTGKLTFQEAQALAAAIADRKAEPLEWLDEGGKSVAKQHGDLKVVRPMPVGCDDKPSGVIMIATFATVRKPSKVMNVKLDGQNAVTFQQQ